MIILHKFPMPPEIDNFMHYDYDKALESGLWSLSCPESMTNAIWEYYING